MLFFYLHLKNGSCLGSYSLSLLVFFFYSERFLPLLLCALVFMLFSEFIQVNEHEMKVNEQKGAVLKNSMFCWHAFGKLASSID